MQSKHLIWKKWAFFLKKALFFEVVKDYIVICHGFISCLTSLCHTGGSYIFRKDLGHCVIMSKFAYYVITI